MNPAGLGPYALNSIVTGDARELAAAIPDESVDLIFTDPVYDRIDDYRWLAETAARVLKPGGNVLAYVGNIHLLDAAIAMKGCLTAHPLLTTYLLPSWVPLWQYHAHANYLPLLWFSRGDGLPQKWIKLQNNAALAHKSHAHRWGKNGKSITKWLDAFTSPGAIVFDPFTGGGTVPAVCKMLQRNYLAFEIDPATAALARERVANTQPPLPLAYATQEALL